MSAAYPHDYDGRRDALAPESGTDTEIPADVAGAGADRAAGRSDDPIRVATAAKVRTARVGLPTDGPALVRRYRAALAEAFEKLGAFGYDADAKEIADRYSLVYAKRQEPTPRVKHLACGCLVAWENGRWVTLVRCVER